jgi:hypothetical protein
MPVAAPLPVDVGVAAADDSAGKGGGGKAGGGGGGKGGGKGGAAAEDEGGAGASAGPNWDLLAQLTGSGAYAAEAQGAAADKAGVPSSAARRLAAAVAQTVACAAGPAACGAWEAKLEGAHAGMLLAQVFQAGMCATAIVVGGWKHFQNSPSLFPLVAGSLSLSLWLSGSLAPSLSVACHLPRCFFSILSSASSPSVFCMCGALYGTFDR